MRKLRSAVLGALGIVCLVALPAHGQQVGRLGARVGLGTDINGGVAFGAQIDYTLFQGPNSLEVGLTGFGGSFEEDSNNGFNDYHETTDIIVVGAMANYLIRHSL